MVLWELKKRVYHLNIHELVESYIDAWNRLDAEGLLALMHPGAAYYDAFWMESCVGSELARYFQDAMDEEPYRYQRLGDVLTTEKSVVFRYSARHQWDSKHQDPILFGADVLVLHDNKILTVTDYYCDPNYDSLKEVAELAGQRHGLPRYTVSGFGALKMLRVRQHLARKIESDKVFLDSSITMSRLAKEIDCTLDELSNVISSHFGMSLDEILNNHRIEYAKSFLKRVRGGPGVVARAAAQSGFKSPEEFSDRFVERVGITPETYWRKQKQKNRSADNSKLH